MPQLYCELADPGERKNYMYRVLDSPRTRAFLSNSRRLVIVASVLHILFTVTIFVTGRLGLVPQHINRAGIGQFAPDSNYFLKQTGALTTVLTQQGVVAWFKDPSQIHVKLYSLSFAALRPVFGSNILTVEPVNLGCYLAILVLTYLLARRFMGPRAALLAPAVVAFWPSLLSHTTQFLRDPLFIAAFLTMVLILMKLIADEYDWRKGLLAGLAGAFAALLLLMSRTDFWMVVRMMVLLSLVLFIVQTFITKKMRVGNAAGIFLLLVVTNFILPLPRAVENQVGISVGTPRVGDVGKPYWVRVNERRQQFVSEGENRSRSMIDPDVAFSSQSDLIKHIPRAIVVGLFAPFPNMWFGSGYNVGIAGRLLAGIETAVTYLMLLPAAIFAWRRRRRLDVWMMVLTVMLGLAALGLVVVNVGTLYRMRYPFWILLVVMATPLLTGWFTTQKRSDLKS